MYEVTVHDNRVVAVRIIICDAIDEARDLVKDVYAALAQVNGLAIATADLRLARLFPQDVSDVFTQLLKGDNPKIERSGHIIGGSAVFQLQVKRMVLEAQNPNRKIFSDANSAEEYLAENLTLSQRQWLREWYLKLPTLE
jgi:hypothetical protein